MLPEAVELRRAPLGERDNVKEYADHLTSLGDKSGARPTRRDHP